MAKRFKQIVEETFDLIEGRMNQLAMDMDELSDSEFKAKHKRSKQQMSTALNKPIKPSNEEQVDESERAKQMQAGWELLRKRRKDNEKAVKDMKGMAPHMKNPALGEEVEGLSEDSTSARIVKDPVHKQAAKLGIVKRGEKDQPQSYQTKFNHKSLGAKENSAEIHTGGPSHRGHKSEHIVNHILKKAGGTEPSNHDDHKQTIGKFNYHVKKSSNGGHVIHINHATHQEEFEVLDELSQDKLMQYRSAAKKQGTGIQDRMKVGGGDWSKDGKDTKTLKKRMSGYKMAGRKVNPGLAATAGKAPRVAANEEVEQLDEILPVIAGVAGRALATRAVGAGASAMTKRVAGAAGSYAGKKLANKVTSTNTSTNTTKEEVEQVDEGLGGAYRYNQMMKRKRNEYQGMVKKHQDAGHDLQTAKNKASQEYDALEAKRRKNARPLPQTRDLMKMSTDELKRLQKKESLEVKPIKLTKGWGDGGKSMKTNKNKLVGNQHKIDANDDGKISTDDFKILRNRNKARNQ